MKILSITPVTYNWAPKFKKDRDRIAGKGTTIESAVCKKGPRSVECMYEVEMAALPALEEIANAEAEGYDAVVIDCAADTGLYGGKEKLSIPVVGAMESAMHVASMLGEKFSILSLVQSGETIFRRLAKLYGLEGKIASIRSINIPVLEMEREWKKLERSILREAKGAVREDHADVIILGCTGMIGLEKKLNRQLPGIPIINPGNVAIKMAELLVDLGLSQSKKSFPSPPGKEIVK